MPEKFAFDSTFGDGSAVYRYVRFVPAVRERVYDAGDVFLANAAFACYQDGDVRRGYNGGFFYRAVQFRRIADYAEALFYFLYVG